MHKKVPVGGGHYEERNEQVGTVKPNQNIAVYFLFLGWDILKLFKMTKSDLYTWLNYKEIILTFRKLQWLQRIKYKTKQVE